MDVSIPAEFAPFPLEVSPQMLNAMALFRTRMLGAQLRDRMVERGLTVEDCARITGLSSETIEAIHDGTHLLSDEMGQLMLKSSIILGISWRLVPFDQAA
jgi:hypothetical protein